jgi:hypothetical protein
MIVPEYVPMPPKIEVPPITVAAIDGSSSEFASPRSAALIRPASRMPEIAASSPHST